LAPAIRQRELLQRLIEEGVVEFGPHSYGTPEVWIDRDPTGRPVGSRLFVGPYCSIAADVRVFLGGGHRPDWISTFPFRVQWNMSGAFEDGHPVSKGDVRIGPDVWIGRAATVMSGVTIGPGAVIAATATVTKDVRPYAIVAGNPARETRRRFADDDVDFLLGYRWWDLPDLRVRELVPLLCSPDLDALRKAVEG
jgi:acetyltransferase-like isoleucine patch superfamily enzyme